MNLKQFYNLIKDICPTYHYESDTADYPRQVYEEYATNYEYSSNSVYTKKVSINLTHFSKKEFDEAEELLEKILMITKDITFQKETSFDEKTKVISNFYDIEIEEEVKEEKIVKEIKELEKECIN